MTQYAEVAVPAEGSLGLAPQTGKGVEQVTASEYRWFMWTGIGFGAAQMMDNLPPAIAASILPRGQFKSMLFGAGDVAFVPSLEKDLYFLLRMVHGKNSVATQTDVKLDTEYGERALVAETGVNVHTFVPDEKRTRLPWATAARKLPNPVSANELEEITRDVKGAALVLNVPGLGILTAQMSLVGIEPRWAAPSFVPSYDREIFAAVNESSCFVSLPDYAKEYTTTAVGTTLTIVASALTAAYPNDDQIVGATVKMTAGDCLGEARTITGFVSSTGTITVGTAFSAASGTSNTFDIVPALPVIGSSVTFDNGVIRPNAPEMQIIGKHTPHDLPSTGVRGAALRLAILVDSEINYDLVTLAMRGAVGAGAWSSTPFKSDVHLRVISPFMITGSVPYTLEFLTVATNGTLSMVDALPLVPGRSMIATFDMVFQETTAPSIELDEIATGTPTTTIIDTTGAMVANAYKNMFLRFDDDTTTSAIRGETRRIASNTTTAITLATASTAAAVAGDTFKVYALPHFCGASAGAASSVTLEAGALDLLADELVGYTISVVSGTAAGQVRTIESNDAADVITVSEAWDTQPIADDEVSIKPPPWMVRLQNAQGAETWPS